METMINSSSRGMKRRSNLYVFLFLYFFAEIVFAVSIPAEKEIEIDLSDNHSRLNKTVDLNKQKNNVLIGGEEEVSARPIIDEKVEARPLLGDDEYQINNIASDSIHGLRELLRDYLHDKDITYTSTLFSSGETVSASPDISSMASPDAVTMSVDQMMSESINPKNYTSLSNPANTAVINKNAALLSSRTSAANSASEPAQKLSPKEIIMIMVSDLVSSPYFYLVLLVFLILWALTFFRHLIFSGHSRSRKSGRRRRRSRSKHRSKSSRKRVHRKSLLEQ